MNIKDYIVNEETFNKANETQKRDLILANFVIGFFIIIFVSIVFHLIIMFSPIKLDENSPALMVEIIFYFSLVIIGIQILSLIIKGICKLISKLMG